MSARRTVAFVLVGVSLVVPRYAVAEGAGGVGVVTALGGEVTVARVSHPRPVALKRHDDVLLHDRIATKERSLARVLLRDRALLTVRELSVLTITEGALRATVDLRSGKLGLSVARQLMKPGEVIDVRSPNVTVAVRGTVLVVETVPGSGPAAVTTRVWLLHGSVDVSLRNDPTAAPVHLVSPQAVEVSGDTFGTVHSLAPEAIAFATTGLSTSELPRPGVPAPFLSALVAQQLTLVEVVGALPAVRALPVAGTLGAQHALPASGLATGPGGGGVAGGAGLSGTLSGAGVGGALPVGLPTGLLPGK